MRLGAGALVWAAFDGPEAPGPVLDAVRDGSIGGLGLFAARGNIRSKAQLRAMLADVQAAAARGGLPPIPVAVDQEGGVVVRIAHRAVFPSAMALAATGDPALAERAAAAVAAGLRADGIRVNWAPVCDVNVEPRNPVIGTRAFGDDPGRVAEFAAAWVRGSQSAGVAAVAKHFPGHGAAPHDTHVTTVDVDATRETLAARELVPFRAAIAAGAAAVMAAHVRYASLDDDVATFSSRILGDLLRTELGFAGLVMTDALDMAGVSHREVPERIAARAVSAGADAVLVMDLGEQLAAAERIVTGVAAPRRLAAIRRAAAFRERFAGPPEEDVDDEPARALALAVARASVTAVRGPLPTVVRPRVTLLPTRWGSPVEERGGAPAVEDALRRRFGPALSFRADGAAPEGDGTLIVCSTSAWFDPAQAARARELLSGGGLLCALRSPYDAALVPGVPALLTYSDVPASLDALADVLAGRRAAAGRLPVTLPS